MNKKKIYFPDFRQVTIMGYFVDFGLVEIIDHFCRLWVGQDYRSFLQTLGGPKILTKLL